MGSGNLCIKNNVLDQICKKARYIYPPNLLEIMQDVMDIVKE